MTNLRARWVFLGALLAACGGVVVPDTGAPPSGSGEPGASVPSEPVAGPDSGVPGGDAAGPNPEPEPEPEEDLPDTLAPLGAGVGTLTGSSKAGTADGARGVARFRNPVNVALGPEGALVVADFDNGLLRRVSADGTTTTLTRQDDFRRPFGLAFAKDGTLWAQTDRNELNEDKGALWKVDTTTGQATLVETNVGRPRGMAVLSDGRLVLAYYMEHVLRIYDPGAPAGSRFTLLAGTAGQAGFADGAGASARFDQPYDVAVLPGDVIVLADMGNHRLRRVSTDGTVETFAGDGVAGSVDGARLAGDGGAVARFHSPQGLAVDSASSLYVTEIGGNVVRRIEGDVVTTIAGSGVLGFADGEDPKACQFHGLEGVDVSADGRFVFVADGDRGEDKPFHRVRRIDRGAP